MAKSKQPDVPEGIILMASTATLSKYGLNTDDWGALVEDQDFKCACCRQHPKKGRLCIDHEHVKGWKAMPPEERKKYVRGLLCWRCNTTYVGRSITIERSKQVTAYLERYESGKINRID